MSEKVGSLFIFGLGYSALRFIERYGVRFSGIAGTARSQTKVDMLRERGVNALPFAGSGVEAAVAGADMLLSSVPPHDDGDPALTAFGESILRARRCRWIGYLSTTGVYGDCSGEWISEQAEIRPGNAQSHWRAQAERDWLALGEKAGIAVQIFRLSGIYGPGRSAFNALRNGTAKRIVKAGQVFNRIHVDDVAAVLMASMEKPRAGAVYNVSDDEPAPPQDVTGYAARLAGIEPPPEIAFEAAGLSPVARSFYAENKRIDNRLIKSELGVRLAYPSYREGLEALGAEANTDPA